MVSSPNRAFLKEQQRQTITAWLNFRRCIGEAGISQKDSERTHAWEDLEKMGARVEPRANPFRLRPSDPIGGEPAARAVAVAQNSFVKPTAPSLTPGKLFVCVHDEERFQLAVKGFLMTRNLSELLQFRSFVFSPLRGQDAKFAADNLKYSRDFYSKVHFVAMASLPASFKYDRYPSGGPTDSVRRRTYARQHGRPWRYLNDKMRTGLPIDTPSATDTL